MATFVLLLQCPPSSSLPIFSRHAAKHAAAYHRYDRKQSLAAQYDSERLSKEGFKRTVTMTSTTQQLQGLRRRSHSDNVEEVSMPIADTVEWTSPVVEFFKRLLLQDSSGLQDDAVLNAPRIQAPARRALRYKDWKDLQISSGWSGHALEEAQRAIQQDWDLGDLLDIGSCELALLERMVQVAKEVEAHTFLPAIVGTQGSLKEDLERGRVKNQILYLYGQCLLSRIRLAQMISFEGGSHSRAGKLETLKLADLEASLDEAVKRDRANDGERSVSVFHDTHALL
ncbi:hypothetical protein BCR37DRAFT_397232 [Protomyces lactucae-debilis]|uniref:Uncharacterized protein n=1 Tax=Protomyces lactucae-debilis TaxID=2754530 RepID=A0A1Y2FNN6_PROLT|nr:uncharacterized protein BCR37DRAFT_397232 [Protomyces lactucae-debilis]ORY85620.1 hypothetical protein BCR37DRAFT_397232 [Protomyces lactucae-debilis]